MTRLGIKIRATKTIDDRTRSVHSVREFPV